MSYDVEEVEIIMMELEEGAEKTISAYKTELQNIRAGRANPHILDKLSVDYYGTPSPINQMATVTVAEARVLVISAWDKSMLKPIEKAILAANIGINPNNDGVVIRLIFPELTEERRKDLVKDIKKSGESSKVALRNHRRDAIDALKKLEKSSGITEDDLERLTADVEKKLSSAVESVEKMMKDKEAEIMSV
ncbi:MAG: ribosome recycling factor [Clostridiaceae bacterium]|jgi:ribosome recycling factor|nr:ribosome recycling factor [Clostridiaceae bacterium]